MITIISGTNRPDNNTLKVAKTYLKLLEDKGVQAKVFSLEDLPHDIAFNELYGKRSVEFQKILDEYIIPAEKLVVISPEYNGSYPGILKIFIDAVDQGIYKGKKAALAGVSTGRSGNLRGMDHLTNIFNYLSMNVYYYKVIIPRIQDVMNEKGEITDATILKSIENQIKGFVDF